jgi:hypothetical protein
MTKYTKPVTRETEAKYVDRPIVVTIEGKGVRVRLKGLKDPGYFHRYEDLFVQGARGHAAV